MPRRTPRTVGAQLAALALMSSLGGSCRSVTTDCKHESTERCLWEAGKAPTPITKNPDVEVGGDTEEPGVASEPTELDETLTQMVAIIGAGLEWSLVDERARSLCSGEPRDPEPGPELPTPAANAWTCAIAELELADQPLALEASEGVLSLSAVDIGDAESAELFELARSRFDGWCAAPFSQFEGQNLQEFHRCSLPDGPYLVVARFPRDLKGNRWQVSIAIVDAG